MSVKVTVKEGDTWDAIAARELGNTTLGREIAGYNGANETGSPAPGTEILIPHRQDATAARRDCGNCGATMPITATYCAECGTAAADGARTRREAITDRSGDPRRTVERDARGEPRARIFDQDPTDDRNAGGAPRSAAEDAATGGGRSLDQGDPQLDRRDVRGDYREAERDAAGFVERDASGAPIRDLRAVDRDASGAPSTAADRTGSPRSAPTSPAGGSLNEGSGYPGRAQRETAWTGKLPSNFPGRDALAAAGVDTYAQLRDAGDVREIRGISDATAAKIDAELGRRPPA